MPDNIEVQAEIIRKNGPILAKNRAKRKYLEWYRKVKKCQLMKKYMAEGHETAAAQEREARADPEYIEVIKGIKEALELEIKADHEIKAAEIQVDIWRTRSANDRSERRVYGA